MHPEEWSAMQASGMIEPDDIDYAPDDPTDWRCEVCHEDRPGCACDRAALAEARAAEASEYPDDLPF
jgi:hypothetical protein